MSAPLEEVKTRARRLLNALSRDEPDAVARARSLCEPQHWPWPAQWQLKHCLNLVAAEIGFEHWEHARRVFGGEAGEGEDMGAFWHAPACNALLNHWFARYGQAREQLEGGSGRFLLPYRKQFVVVTMPYLDVVGIVADSQLWHELGHDLVAAYGSSAWQALCTQRMKASRVP